MTKRNLIQKVSNAYHLTVNHSYEARAVCPKESANSMHGYVVNNQYFIDKSTQKIYPMSDLSQVLNLDAYND